MQNTQQNQHDNNQNYPSATDNCLKNKEENATPTPLALLAPSLLDEEALQHDAMVHAEKTYENAANWHKRYVTSAVPPRPPRKKRIVGRLIDITDYRRELAAVYKEAYYGAISWADLTRATYALDCMMKSALLEKRRRSDSDK